MWSCMIRGQLTILIIEGDFYMSFNKAELLFSKIPILLLLDVVLKEHTTMHENGSNSSPTDFPVCESGVDVQLAAGPYGV